MLSVLRWWVVGLSLVLVALTAGCEGCGSESRPHETVVIPHDPVPEPAGLLAKLVVPHPGRLLGELRASAGGGAVMFPRSVGGLVVAQLGLPLQVIEHFDDDVPIVGAATADDDGMHVAVAFHVRSTARVLAASTKGEDASFTSEKDSGEGALEDSFYLEPTGKSIRKPGVTATLVMVDSYLVAADSRDGARRLAHYLTRTLSTDTTPHARLVVNERAAKDYAPLAFRDLRQWLTTVAWPSAFAAVLDLQEMVASLEPAVTALGAGEVSLEVTPDAFVVSASAAMDPSVKAPPEIAATTLARLPDDVMVAATWAESTTAFEEEARTRGAKLGAAARKGLGTTWTKEEDDIVANALGLLAQGRGATTLMGLRCSGVGVTGLAQGTVRSMQPLNDGLALLMALPRREAIQTKLSETGVTLSAKRTRILEVPDELWRVRMRPPTKKGEHSEEIDLLARVGQTHYLVAAGMETVDTIQRLFQPDEARSLAVHPLIGASLKRVGEELGGHLWLAMMVDPRALHSCATGHPGRAPSAPIVVGVAPRAEGGVSLRIEVSRSVLAGLTELMR